MNHEPESVEEVEECVQEAEECVYESEECVWDAEMCVQEAEGLNFALLRELVDELSRSLLLPLNHEP